MQALAFLLMIPLLLLNLLGGLVGGVWLAIEGEWGLVGLGLVAAFVAPMILGFFVLVGGASSFPGLWLFQQGGLGKLAAYPLLFLGLLWTYVVMFAWSIGIFWIGLTEAGHDLATPAALWSYAVATGPWGYLAQKDAMTGNTSASLPTAFLQMGALVCVVFIFLQSADIFSLGLILAVALSASLLIQTVAFVVSAQQDSP